MSSMIHKKCLYYGKTCWHNPTPTLKGETSNPRCTFCGHPVGGSVGPKRVLAEQIRDTQRNKAAKELFA